MKKDDSMKSIIVLVVICLVISAALAIVNSVTHPIISAAAAERETASRQAILPEAVDFTKLESDAIPESVVGAYKGVDGSGDTVGYVFTIEGKGFDGTITVMCAIDSEGLIVRCATIDVTSETKTLGGQTANASYTDQYTGKDATLAGVNAISGATITSIGYEGCVANAFLAYEAVKEG